MSEKIGIELLLQLDSLERPAERETVMELEEHDFELAVYIEVVPLAPDRFRIPGATSLTPFGPLGPTLNLGDVIETAPLSEGVHRFVRRLESARVWSRTLYVPHVSRAAIGDRERRSLVEQQQFLHDLLRGGRVGALLEEIERAGGGWEYAVGNVTVQLPLPEGSELPAHLQELVDELFEHLLPLAAKRRRGPPAVP